MGKTTNDVPQRNYKDEPAKCYHYGSPAMEQIFNLFVLYLPLLKDLSFPGSHIPPVCIQHFDCLPVSVTTEPVYSATSMLSVSY